MKKCVNCGAELEDEQSSCPNCGKACAQDEVRKKWDAASIVGFCISVVGVIINFTALLTVFVNPNIVTVLLLVVAIIAGCSIGTLGAIISVIGLILVIKKQKRGKGFAIAGIVTGALCFVLLTMLGIQ